MTGEPLDSSRPSAASESREPTLALINLYREGDEDALATLWMRHKEDLLRSVAVRMCADLRRVLDAEELVAEVFMRVAQKLKDGSVAIGSSRGNLLNYLITAVLNELTDQRRYFGAQKREIHRHASSVDVAQCGNASSPSQSARSSEHFMIIHEALLELPEIDRRVLDLELHSGMNDSEIQEALKLKNVGVVRVRRNRAREKLHRILKGRLGEDSLLYGLGPRAPIAPDGT